MADTPISLPAVTTSPADYKMADGVEYRIKAVYAEFVNVSATVDWLPTVTIYSDANHVIANALDPGVKVTAGDDAEVSFFPRVGLSSSGALTSRRPVIYLVGTAAGVQTTTSGVGFNRQFYRAGGFSYQPDPTVYSVNDLGGGLCDTVTFLKAGQYLVTAGYIYASAAAFLRQWTLTLLTSAGLPLARGVNEYATGAGDSEANIAQLYEATTSAVAGGFAQAQVSGLQSSGGNVGVQEGYFSIIQLSDVAQ